MPVLIMKTIINNCGSYHLSVIVIDGNVKDYDHDCDEWIGTRIIFYDYYDCDEWIGTRFIFNYLLITHTIYAITIIKKTIIFYLYWN